MDAGPFLYAPFNALTIQELFVSCHEEHVFWGLCKVFNNKGGRDVIFCMKKTEDYNYKIFFKSVFLTLILIA